MVCCTSRQGCRCVTHKCVHCSHKANSRPWKGSLNSIASIPETYVMMWGKYKCTYQQDLHSPVSSHYFWVQLIPTWAIWEYSTTIIAGQNIEILRVQKWYYNQSGLATGPSPSYSPSLPNTLLSSSLAHNYFPGWNWRCTEVLSRWHCRKPKLLGPKHQTTFPQMFSPTQQPCTNFTVKTHVAPMYEPMISERIINWISYSHYPPISACTTPVPSIKALVLVFEGGLTGVELAGILLHIRDTLMQE